MSNLNIFAIRKDGLSFIKCLEAAVATPELIEQFDRLYGTNLSLKGTPIERMVDEATGKIDADFRKFAEFVWEFVFTRIPLEASK